MNRTARVMILVVGLAIVLLTACGDADEAEPGTGGGEVPQETGPEPTSEPKPKAERTVTAVGTVVPGVESGCLLLSGTPYQLLGDAGLSDLEGARVRVTGIVREGLMTICQQGTPLEVTRVSPVDVGD